MPTSATTTFFVAVLAKESAYWVLPRWAYEFAADLREVNTPLLKSFYFPIFAFGVRLGIVYLVFCAWAWGDPLARIRSTQFFLCIDQDLSSWMRRADHSQTCDAEIQALDLITVYDETKVLLFKADAPADITARLQAKP